MRRIDASSVRIQTLNVLRNVHPQNRSSFIMPRPIFYINEIYFLIIWHRFAQERFRNISQEGLFPNPELNRSYISRTCLRTLAKGFRNKAPFETRVGECRRRCIRVRNEHKAKTLTSNRADNGVHFDQFNSLKLSQQFAKPAAF